MTQRITRVAIREYILRRESEINHEARLHEKLMGRGIGSFFYDDIALGRQRTELENLARWFNIPLHRGKVKTEKRKP